MKRKLTREERKAIRAYRTKCHDKGREVRTSADEDRVAYAAEHFGKVLPACGESFELIQDVLDWTAELAHENGLSNIVKYPFLAQFRGSKPIFRSWMNDKYGTHDGVRGIRQMAADEHGVTTEICNIGIRRANKRGASDTAELTANIAIGVSKSQNCYAMSANKLLGASVEKCTVRTMLLNGRK